MIKLRTILLQSNIYRVTIVGVIIYALIVTLLPKYESVYKGSEEDFLCSIDNYKIEEDKMNLELACKEKLVGSYYFKNGMMPYNRTSAIVSLSSALVIVVLYIFFTDFFINASVLIALLFPIFVVTYYLIRVVDNSLSILMG